MGRSERAARTKEIIQFSSYFGEEINNKTSIPKRRFCDECLIKKRKFVAIFQMRQDVMDACVALRTLCETLRAQRRRASLSLSSMASSNGQTTSVSSSGSSDESIPRLDGKQDTGLLNYLVKDIDQLVRGSAWVQLDFSQCEQCGRSPNDLLQLESELHLTQEAADRLQRNLADKTEESKRRDEEATSFKNQVLYTTCTLLLLLLSPIEKSEEERPR